MFDSVIFLKTYYTCFDLEISGTLDLRGQIFQTLPAILCWLLAIKSAPFGECRRVQMEYAGLAGDRVSWTNLADSMRLQHNINKVVSQEREK